MNFTVWGPLLDQVYQQRQISIVALVLNCDLGSSENLEDVSQEEIGSVLLVAVVACGLARGTLASEFLRQISVLAKAREGHPGQRQGDNIVFITRCGIGVPKL